MTAAGETEAELSRVATSRGSEARTVMTLNQALKGTHNSLGVIRLVLAALVIVDHAFILGGFGHNPIHTLTRGQASLGSLSVAGFFAISGYLIAKSGTSGDVVQFLWRRTLRIFPAYWVVLVVTALLAGPLLWISSGKQLGAYFALPGDGPWNYLAANWGLGVGAHGIGGLLLTTPYGELTGMSEFNGSLWTLVLEWTCYMIIAVFVASGAMRYARALVGALAVLFLLVQLDVITVPAIYTLANPSFAGLALVFLTGSVLAVYADRVPFHDGLGVLSGLALVASLRFGGFEWLGLVAGAYFVLYMAVRLPRRLQWIGRKNDYSYGIYIYGFLVQQVLAHYGVHKLGYLPYMLIALILAFGLAWLSWHGVEKRAMALKGWGPGRGWRHWYQRLARRGR